MRSLIVLFAIFSLAISAPSVHAAWLIDRSGTLVEVEGVVLGEDTDISQEQRELKQNRLEQATQLRLRTQEVRQESVRTRLENSGAALRIHQVVQGEDGQLGRELEEVLPIRERLRLAQPEGDPLEIVASDSGELELSRNQVRARTRHPLTIGENNELIVTRPDGTTKIVTVLPDTAAAKMREQGFAQLDNDVELDVEGDQPVYRFATRRVRRLLGLFPTEFTGETSVSAETGEIVGTASTEVTLFRRFLETLSF